MRSTSSYRTRTAVSWAPLATPRGYRARAAAAYAPRVNEGLDPTGRSRLRDSASLAALLGWVVPGLGHLWVGRAGKALHYFVVIGAAWALGLWLTDGLGVSYERHPIWLAAEAWLAGPTLAAAWATKDLTPLHRVDTFDVGQLYLAVSSLLNLVAVADAIGIADLRAAARRRAARAAAVAAAAAAAAAATVEPAAATIGHPPTAAQDGCPPPAPLEPAPSPPPAPAPEPSPTAVVESPRPPDDGGTP